MSKYDLRDILCIYRIYVNNTNLIQKTEAFRKLDMEVKNLESVFLHHRQTFLVHPYLSGQFSDKFWRFPEDSAAS